MTGRRLGTGAACAAMVVVVAILLATRIELSERMPEWHDRTAALIGLGFWVAVLFVLILGVRRLGRRWSDDDQDPPPS